jgi:hypothetical protein
MYGVPWPTSGWRSWQQSINELLHPGEKQLRQKDCTDFLIKSSWDTGFPEIFLRSDRMSLQNDHSCLSNGQRDVKRDAFTEIEHPTQPASRAEALHPTSIFCTTWVLRNTRPPPSRAAVNKTGVCGAFTKHCSLWLWVHGRGRALATV